MTSTPNASERRNLQAVVGNYTNGLSGGLSPTGSRSLLAAPAIGDAFADVFRMFATAQRPADPAASNVSPNDGAAPTGGPKSAESKSESGENESDELEEEETANAPRSASGEPLVASDTANESLVSVTESEQQAGAPADPDADSTADADATLVQETTTESVANTVAGVQVTKDAANDPQPITDATSTGESKAATPVVNANNVPQPGQDNAAVAQPLQAEALSGSPATSVAVAEAGELPSATETSDDTDAPPRYAGEPDDTTGRKRTSSNRRHHGERPADPQASDPLEASRPANSAPASAAQGVASSQASSSASADSQALSPGQFAFSEPAATTSAVPLAAVAQAQPLPAAAASKAGQAVNAAGSDVAGPKPTAPASAGATEPPAGSESRAVGTSKEANEGPRVADRALLVQRVSRAFQRLGVDGGQVRIRLHPEELGGVQLQLSVQGQRMSARVVAETEAARSILTQHLPELRQRLADQGMQVERLEVQLEGEQDSGGSSDFLSRDRAGQGRAGQGNGSPHQGSRRHHENAARSTERSSPPDPRSGGGARTVIQAAQQNSVDLIG